MDVHCSKLCNLCRLCASEHPVLSSKLEFQREIALIWGVHVQNDDDSVHPLCICSPCRQKIKRWKENRRKKSKPQPQPNIELFEFSPHQNNCNLCKGHEWNRKVLYEACKSADFFTWDKADKVIGIIVDGEGVQILKRIVIDIKNSTVQCFALGKEVNVSFTSPLAAVKHLASARLCPGNLNLDDLAKNHKTDGFFARDGTQVATVEVNHQSESDEQVDNYTIRCTSCKILLPGDDIPSNKPMEMCSVCTIYRSTLLALDAKEKTCRPNPIFSESTKPTKYMTVEELRHTVEDLRREKRNIVKKNKRLLDKVSCLIQQEGVAIDEATSQSVGEIVGSVEDEISALFPQASHCRILWEEQKKALACKPKQMRWHPAIIRWAIAIHTKSASAYNTLRKSGFLRLPHENTLYRYTHFTNPGTGINEELLAKFYEDFKMDTLMPHERMVSLLIDEMKIKSGLVFSQSTGKLVGFTSISNIVDDMEDFEKRCTDEEKEHDTPLAYHVLLFMVRGITSAMKFPAAYYATSNVRGSELYQLTMEVTKALKFLGLTVLCLTSDGASANRKLYEILGGSVEGTMPPFNCRSVFDEGKLFFYCDPPHLLKTIRNNFENSNWNRGTRNLMYKGQRIQWTQLVQLQEWDQGIDRAAPGLRLLPKLRYEHLHLSPGLRMKVNLAAQVMSNSVANALEVWKKPGLKSTILFIRKVNKFFDCLNVASTTEGVKKRNQDLMPYTSEDDSRLNWLKDDFLQFLQDWEDEGKKLDDLSRKEVGKLFLSKATAAGCRISVNSFVEITRILLKMDGVKYVLSDKFNQDPLEEFFGKQRGAGGHRDNPTLDQFGHSLLRNVVAGSRSFASVRGNVRLLEDEGTTTTEEPLPKRKRQTTRFVFSKEAPN